jgi:transposase
MKSIKTILRMYLVDNRSIRNIAGITGISYSTVHDNITLAMSKGISAAQIDFMDEETLELLLFARDKQRSLPPWDVIENELKRAGVTLQLLWREYKEANPDGYQYSRFCEMYEDWSKKNDVYTPIPHKAGEELFVDYSGDKMDYTCPETGFVLKAEIFVAVLGASGRIYMEASKSQCLSCWIDSNINAFEYNGGVTELIIPDNLKSGVTKPNRYEPYINRVYEEMGNYYGTHIFPARVARPRDKAKVEQSVQLIQRNIIAPLRDRVFFGLHALNEAILERLKVVNEKPFQKRPGSRQSCYEAVDKPALKALPKSRYHQRDWITKLSVGQNHHVLILKHSYSVPFKYSREEVEASIDSNMVEIFYKGEIIARHPRSYVEGTMTTTYEHIPPRYRHFFESYDKEKLLQKAKELGPNIFAWAEDIFKQKGRAQKLLCRTVQGTLSLAKEFGKERLDLVCERALGAAIHSYKVIKSMLINGADRLPAPQQGSTQSRLPQKHSNVRGPRAFS